MVWWMFSEFTENTMQNMGIYMLNQSRAVCSQGWNLIDSTTQDPARQPPAKGGPLGDMMT